MENSRDLSSRDATSRVAATLLLPHSRAPAFRSSTLHHYTSHIHTPAFWAPTLHTHAPLCSDGPPLPTSPHSDPTHSMSHTDVWGCPMTCPKLPLWSHMGETVSRMQYRVQAVCYMYDRTCSADSGADRLNVHKRHWERDAGVLQKTGCSGTCLPSPPLPSPLMLCHSPHHPSCLPFPP